jgi:rare lipoprotein A
MCITALVFACQISYAQTLSGTASFYAQKFNGRKMANGSTFNNAGNTCACNKLPLGTRVLVTNIRNGKSIELTVTDRLAANNKRIVDVTVAAAKSLGFYNAGLTKVKVEVLSGKKKEKLKPIIDTVIDSMKYDIHDTAMELPKLVK